MGRKSKVTIEEENGSTIISGTAEAITNALTRAGEQMKRKPIEIRGAELKDQMFCNYQYKHTVGPNTVNSVSIKSELPVHHDLTSNFRRLDAHLAVICEEVDSTKINDIEFLAGEIVAEKISKFTVTSFKLDGYDDDTSVLLSGLKELSTGEAIKLETPWINLDDSYPFAVELSSCIHDLVSEVEQYMEGKQAENPQQELPFETETFAEEGR